ncbi:MAG TPA: MFS transporter [Verrucomicrobiae bacterium]|nr:MFS transporter [Verrucomicrobiae bacterium]
MDERELESNRSYAILRNRDLRLYLSGRLIAVIGQQMLAIAIGWELFFRTHSLMKLSYVGLTQVAPMILFTLPAGHVADSYNRKRIITLMTLVVAISSLGLAIISKYQASILWMYACLFVSAAARTFLTAASASFLPSLVERKDLSRAVNWSATTFQFSSIVGPAIFSGLIWFAGHKAYPIYIINFFAAIIFCVMMTQIHTHHVVANREKMSFKTLLTGFNFVFANKIILGIISLDMFAVLLGGATALLPVYTELILKVGPEWLGFLQMALPIGSFLCTFILAHRPPIQKAGHSLLWAVTGFGVATIGFGLSRWFWLSFSMLFICGVVDNISVVVRHTLVQLLTPDDKRGRVSAVNNLFIGTSNEMGEFESGAVAQLLGPVIGNSRSVGAVLSVVIGGFGTIGVVIAIALIFPQIRKYGRLDA